MGLIACLSAASSKVASVAAPLFALAHLQALLCQSLQWASVGSLVSCLGREFFERNPGLYFYNKTRADAIPLVFQPEIGRCVQAPPIHHPTPVFTRACPYHDELGRAVAAPSPFHHPVLGPSTTLHSTPRALQLVQPGVREPGPVPVPSCPGTVPGPQRFCTREPSVGLPPL